MNTFNDLGLSTFTKDAVQQLGFEKPMPVQQQVIPLLLQKQTDIVALAQTGTGKTAAFGLPLIERTEHSLNMPQALILAPTRELCIQITRDLKSFAYNQHQINTLAVYGGSSINKQIKALNRGVQIIAATPGRLLDLLRRDKIDTSAISTVVLDEADELLNMGFKKDLNAIFDTLPRHYNTWLFSATMPNSVARIAKKYMNNPQKVTVGTKNAGAENVSHQYLLLNKRDRYEALKRLIDFNEDMYAIVFCRTRRNTQKIAKKLSRDGYDADAIHGDLSQSQRDRVMGKFRKKNIRLMIATDVASRGIDVNDITHIINYELPDELESYTHRSGRTGRAGNSGICISMTGRNEKKKIRKLENTVKQNFKRIEIPKAGQLQKKKVNKWAEKVKQADSEHIESILPTLKNQFKELERDELIRQFAAAELSQSSRNKRRNTDSNGRSNSSLSADNSAEAGFERFFINLGKKDDLNPGSLIAMINEETRSGNINIGKIDLLGSFSFFEIEQQYTDTVLKAFKRKVTFKGRGVQVEIAKPKK